MKHLFYQLIGTALEPLFFDALPLHAYAFEFGPEYLPYTEDRTKRKIVRTTTTTYIPKWSKDAPIEVHNTVETFQGHVSYYQDGQTDRCPPETAKELDQLWKEHTDSVVHIRFGQRHAHAA